MKREQAIPRRILTVALAAVVSLAACSSDNDDDGAAETTAAAAGSDDTAASDTSAADAESEDTETTDSDDASATTAGDDAGGDDAGGEDAGAGASGGSVRLGIQLEPPTMDLTSNPAAGIPQVLLYNVYETLVRLDADGAIQPLLAESYEVSDDGLTYSFKLREGVKYHGGEDFTAEDVVYSIENVKNKTPEHPFKASFDPIASVTAVDDYNVDIVLSQPSANLIFFLTQGQGSILDSEGAGDLAAGANGTGPFAFGEWLVGDHLTLNRNDDYWGDAAKSASIDYRYIADPNALNNAMLSGELDIVPNVSAPELLTEFENNDEFTVQSGETYGEIVVALNGDNAPLDDVRVRQAITHAIDSQAIIDLTFGGYGTPIGTMSTPLDPYFKDNNDVYPYDPEKAKELLADAGVSDVTLRFVVPPISYATRGAEVIQSQLAEVGITTEITQMDDFGPWVEQVITNQDYDMSIVAHVEPNDLAQYGNEEYYWGPDSPAVTDLIAQADAEPDEDARNALYQQALDEVTAQAADTWLYVLPQLAVSRSTVEGYEPAALSLSMASVSVNG